MFLCDDSLNAPASKRGEVLYQRSIRQPLSLIQKIGSNSTNHSVSMPEKRIQPIKFHSSVPKVFNILKIFHSSAPKSPQKEMLSTKVQLYNQNPNWGIERQASLASTSAVSTQTTTHELPPKTLNPTPHHLHSHRICFQALPIDSSMGQDLLATTCKRDFQNTIFLLQTHAKKQQDEVKIQHLRWEQRMMICAIANERQQRSFHPIPTTVYFAVQGKAFALCWMLFSPLDIMIAKSSVLNHRRFVTVLFS